MHLSTFIPLIGYKEIKNRIEIEKNALDKLAPASSTDGTRVYTPIMVDANLANNNNNNNNSQSVKKGKSADQATNPVVNGTDNVPLAPKKAADDKGVGLAESIRNISSAKAARIVHIVALAVYAVALTSIVMSASGLSFALLTAKVSAHTGATVYGTSIALKTGIALLGLATSIYVITDLFGIIMNGYEVKKIENAQESEEIKFKVYV